MSGEGAAKENNGPSNVQKPSRTPVDAPGASKKQSLSGATAGQKQSRPKQRTWKLSDFEVGKPLGM